MAGNNTEKPTGKAEQKKQAVALPKIDKKNLDVAPVKKEEKKENIDAEKNITPLKEKTETKEKKIEVKKIKKEKVMINITNSQVSTKYAIAICNFIKGKKIQKAIEELESVSLMKTAIPMKGEIPHRKGKIMSGRFPVRASKEFIILLKSLQSNATQHDLNEPIIVEAVSNKGSTVYGKGGRTQKKRTHLKIVAAEKNKIKTNKK